METIVEPLLEYGVAQFAVPGENASGDLHLVRCNRERALVAAIDGIGHGEEAANAAKVAAEILNRSMSEPIISSVECCHEKLRSTRGVVMSLASIDQANGMMTWLGVGNVQGVLLRARDRERRMQENLLLRAGVVGSQLPPLQGTVVRVARGDTLVFATDGIRGDFIEGLSAMENPQRAADRILQTHRTGNDDALVLVVRLTGVGV
jgi:negative regulator of sigma-B (phosphoserine phosphatase)